MVLLSCSRHFLNTFTRSSTSDIQKNNIYIHHHHSLHYKLPRQFPSFPPHLTFIQNSSDLRRQQQLIISVILMINLYKQTDIRTKSKTMFPVNKSHIASMNLRLNTETITPEPIQRQPLRNATNRIDNQHKNSKSGHKYKKSLILHETTIQLVKKNSEIRGKDAVGMSTERLSKQHQRKRSIDYGATRIKTDMDQLRTRQEQQMVEIGVQELREMVGKLRALRSQKQSLRRQLSVFKECFRKSPPLNAVLRALAPL